MWSTAVKNKIIKDEVCAFGGKCEDFTWSGLQVYKIHRM